MIVVAENLAVLGFSILGCKFLLLFFFSVLGNVAVQL